MPEEQNIHADHHGYQREHVKHDDCMSSHASSLFRPPRRVSRLARDNAERFSLGGANPAWDFVKQAGAPRRQPKNALHYRMWGRWLGRTRRRSA